MSNSRSSGSANLPSLPFEEYKEPEPWPELPREAWPSPLLQVVTAKHIADTLDLLGHYHKLVGLESGTDPDSLNRDRIAAGYDNNQEFERVQLLAGNKIDPTWEAAKNEFAKTFGLISDEVFGIVRESDDFDRLLPGFLGVFDREYFGPGYKFIKRRANLRLGLDEKMHPPKRGSTI